MYCHPTVQKKPCIFLLPQTGRLKRETSVFRKKNWEYLDQLDLYHTEALMSCSMRVLTEASSLLVLLLYHTNRGSRQLSFVKTNAKLMAIPKVCTQRNSSLQNNNNHGWTRYPSIRERQPRGSIFKDIIPCSILSTSLKHWTSQPSIVHSPFKNYTEQMC